VRRDAHCYQCSVIGHFKKECPELKKSGIQPRRFNVQVLLMDLSTDELFEMKELLASMDLEGMPQDGPLTDAEASDFCKE
jgi:hypothetical protein